MIAFKQNKQAQTIELSRLYVDPSCERREFAGKVVKRDFDKDALTLSGIVIEHSNGAREYLNISIPENLDMATSSVAYDGTQRLTQIGREVRGRLLAWSGGARVEHRRDTLKRLSV